MATLVSNGKIATVTGPTWGELVSRLADWFEYFNAALAAHPRVSASEFAKAWETFRRRSR